MDERMNGFSLNFQHMSDMVQGTFCNILGMFKPLVTRFYFILFIHLFIGGGGNYSVIATLRASGWIDFHEIFRIYCTWYKDYSLIFWACCVWILDYMIFCWGHSSWFYRHWTTISYFHRVTPKYQNTWSHGLWPFCNYDDCPIEMRVRQCFGNFGHFNFKSSIAAINRVTPLNSGRKKHSCRCLQPQLTS